MNLIHILFESINCLNGINEFTSLFKDSKRLLFVCKLCMTFTWHYFNLFKWYKDDIKLITSTSEKKVQQPLNTYDL